MRDRWLKWMIGIGSITTFTLFLQSINTDGEKETEKYILKENNNFSQKDLAIDKEEREKQLMALDWDETNWDIEYRNDVIIANPKSGWPYMDHSEQRTRRS